LKPIKRTGRPRETTIKRAAVIKDAGQQETIAGLRRGLAQAKKGLGRPVYQVFDDLEMEFRR